MLVPLQLCLNNLCEAIPTPPLPSVQPRPFPSGGGGSSNMGGGGAGGYDPFARTQVDEVIDIPAECIEVIDVPHPLVSTRGEKLFTKAEVDEILRCALEHWQSQFANDAELGLLGSSFQVGKAVADKWALPEVSIGASVAENLLRSTERVAVAAPVAAPAPPRAEPWVLSRLPHVPEPELVQIQAPLALEQPPRTRSSSGLWLVLGLATAGLLTAFLVLLLTPEEPKKKRVKKSASGASPAPATKPPPPIRPSARRR